MSSNSTGLTISMRWQDINFENRTWYLHQAQKIYLMKDALTILARRYKENNTESIWVFPNSKSSNHLQVRKSWQKICQLAGINGLMIHDLRMTHDVWMSKAGVKKRAIMTH